MRFAVGLQAERDLIVDDIREVFPEATIEFMDDNDAALAIKNKKLDYYFGACDTGGANAIERAIEILGKDKCAVISVPGRVSSKEIISKYVRESRKVFGFTSQHRDDVMPHLLKFIEKRQKTLKRH